MSKNYYDSFLIQIDPPAIVQYHKTEKKLEMREQIQINDSTQPLDLIFDYMQKRIDQIDQTRKNFKTLYPDLIPEIL